MHQHRGAALAFHQGGNRRPTSTDNQVTLPVPRNGAIGGFSRTLADHDVSADVPLRLVLRRPLGTRSARPVRKHATNSQLSAPRPWMKQ